MAGPHGTGYQAIVPVGLDRITKRYSYRYGQADTEEEATARLCGGRRGLVDHRPAGRGKRLADGTETTSATSGAARTSAGLPSPPPSRRSTPSDAHGI